MTRKNKNDLLLVVPAARTLLPLVITCVLCLFFAVQSSAQQKANPLRNKKWFTTGVGMTNADGIAWTAGSTYAFRSEEILTAFRLSYSQELFASPEDSCVATKSKTLEMAGMWGDGWSGKRWYIYGTLGMGLNHRWYCDDVAGDTIPLKMTRFTFSLPAHIEAGFNLSEEYKIAVVGVANWNLMQPYVGGMLCLSYWPAKKRK